ncbi:UNVERIFIED_CONTAM: hypothetical protein FKN15_031858 [Acipenser sinensis]
MVIMEVISGKAGVIVLSFTPPDQVAVGGLHLSLSVSTPLLLCTTPLLQRSTSQKLQDLCSRRSLRLRDLVTSFPAELTQTANWNGFCAESARHKRDL